MNINFRTISLLVSFFIVFVAKVSAQTDSIVFTNNNFIVGEIKTLQQGIIVVETDYSDSDFKMEWDKIKFVKSDQIYLVTLKKGGRYNGSIETVVGDSSKIMIHDMHDGDIVVNMMDIVFLKAIDQNFASRIDLLLSLGYTLTKANNNQQFSAIMNFGYLSNTYALNANFNMIRGFQEQTQDSSTVEIITRRTEGGAGVRAFIFKDWFAMINTDLLQSTEMQLELRAITKAGFGNYIVNNQQMYFVVAAGADWNYENYTVTTDSINPKNSAELFLGLEYKIFDIGDLDLVTSVYGYPSLTESGRFRTDFNFDLRYEFAFDLFFGVGFTLNYDNRPAPGSDPADYVLQTTIGWEF